MTDCSIYTIKGGARNKERELISALNNVNIAFSGVVNGSVRIALRRTVCYTSDAEHSEEGRGST